DHPGGAWKPDIDVIIIVEDLVEFGQRIGAADLEECRRNIRPGRGLLGHWTLVVGGTGKRRDEGVAPRGAVARAHAGLFVRGHGADHGRRVESPGQAGPDRYVAAHPKRDGVLEKLVKALDAFGF